MDCSTDCLGCAVAWSAGCAPDTTSCTLLSSPLGVGGSEVLSLEKRGVSMAGDFLEGTVLLRWTPDPLEALKTGVTGVGTPEFLECLDEVETLRLTPPNFWILEAAALEAAEADRPNPDCLRPLGVVGVFACGVDGPLSICLTVPSSTAVPSIPIKKWS